MRNQNLQQQELTILVTGGAGYVGSHSVLLLLNQEYRVVVVDNCSNAYVESSIDENGNVQEIPESLQRVEQLAGRRLEAFYKLDLVNDNLDQIFQRHSVIAVVHFAALKSVSESIGRPLDYYSNNLIGTIKLLECMKRHFCTNLIFSSSATVYGLPQYNPVDEKHQVGQNVLNPYGRTKCMIEQILLDLSNGSISQDTESAASNLRGWKIIALRYFNPVGAHPSGYIGEHSQTVPNNLMPYISQVSIGKRDMLYVFGDNFDTVDGTGVRDYIHIMDLASGHTHALDHLLKGPGQQDSSAPTAAGSPSFFKVYNLGTGRGHSVLEVINKFQQVNGVRVPYRIVGRRVGDAGEVYADPSLAQKELAWKAKLTLDDMCRDTYRWQCSQPEGYKSPRPSIAHAGAPQESL